MSLEWIARFVCYIYEYQNLVPIFFMLTIAHQPQGNILLVDEIHTPDSSRYWLGSSYKQRMEEKQDPESVDKDIVRRWYVKNSDPYKGKLYIILEMNQRTSSNSS